MTILAIARCAALLSATALLLTACGGGGGGSTAEVGSAASTARAAAPMSAPDAVRLAKQASFGPNQALVDHIIAVNIDAWLEEQFAATGSTYSDLATRVAARNYCNLMTGTAATICNRDYMSSTPLAMRFYSDAMQ